MTSPDTVKLADLCDLVAVQVDPVEHAGSLYVGLEHVASGQFVRIGGGAGADVQSSKFAFEKGDILYGKLRPYLDKAVLADTGGICTTELLVLRAKAGVDPRFLIGVVHAPRFIEQAVAGTTGVQHPRASWAHISEFELPKFDTHEQKQIAELLWMVHDAITACDATIRSGAALKRTSMRELFTRGLKGEPQKETEIGQVPDGWTFERLGDVAEIEYGAQAAVANAIDPTIGTLILTNVNLDLDGHINLEKRRYYKVPEAHKERLSLRKGDVLFNWRSGSADHVGKTVYFDLDGEYTYSSFILRFRPHRCVANKYLFRWLTYLRINGFFVSQRNVSSINSVYNASLSSTIPIWFPPEDEQNDIIAILDAIDLKIDLHRRKRAVLDELFKTLLHKLMTGEIRISDLDLSVLDLETKAEAAE
ncbi:MAG: restriction endonuclease subunit S [Proteobacteria bacterium]|nr:restriction endonuclease subunit S [Pseudomonadota bacterium]